MIPNEEKVIFRFTPDQSQRESCGADDVPDEYVVERQEHLASGIVIRARYEKEWQTNPNCIRPLILHLLYRLTAPVIDMLLWCPQCGEQHIDEARPDVCETCGGVEDEYTHSSERVCSCPVFTAWLNPPHKSHRCASCNHVFRPADVPTNGVKELRTKGQNDGDPRPRHEEALKLATEHGRLLGGYAKGVEDERDRYLNAILAHHEPRGNDRCWERDFELYRAAGIEPGDPENPPIEEHRRKCDEYRASVFGVPVDGEPCSIVEGLKAENQRLARIMAEEMVFASESNALRRELEKVTEDRDSWRKELETYVNAWQRELGGSIIKKTHQIDGFVLTTREMREERDRLKAEVRTWRSKNSEEVWYWQGDGSDHLPSLVCPIIIRPDLFRQMHTKQYQLELLLAAYRAKRAVDGGGALEREDGSKTPSRVWDACKHYVADLRIEDLEAAILANGLSKESKK